MAIERDYPKAEARRITLVEQVRNLGDRLDKQLEREHKILARLKRLEERVDDVVGEDPKEVETELGAYAQR